MGVYCDGRNTPTRSNPLLFNVLIGGGSQGVIVLLSSDPALHSRLFGRLGLLASSLSSSSKSSLSLLIPTLSCHQWKWGSPSFSISVLYSDDCSCPSNHYSFVVCVGGGGVIYIPTTIGCWTI